MCRLTFKAMIFLAAAIGAAGQSTRRVLSEENGPQRTTATAAPANPTATATPTASDEAYIRSAVENYRRSWERMGGRTQKMLLSHGGQTPDQFEQKLRQTLASRGGAYGPQQFLPGRPAAPAPISPAAVAPNGGMNTADSGRELNLDVLNSMKTSSEDLNSIRDGNVRRVQKSGCAPEIALRISELRDRLAVSESALEGRPADKTISTEPGAQSGTSDPPDSVNQQLDSVLGIKNSDSRSAERTIPKPPDAEERRKKAETEIALTRAELDSLAGACAVQR